MKIFYYTIRTLGDGDKFVQIYEIKKNKPINIGDLDVGWGTSAEDRVEAYIKEKALATKFYCVEL